MPETFVTTYCDFVTLPVKVKTITLEPLDVKGPVQAHLGGRKQTYKIGVVPAQHLDKAESSGFSERAPGFRVRGHRDWDPKHPPRLYISRVYLIFLKSDLPSKFSKDMDKPGNPILVQSHNVVRGQIQTADHVPTVTVSKGTVGVKYYYQPLSSRAVNIVNIILFQSPNTTLQPSASTLGMAVTMIFSARFILNLSEHAWRDGISGERTHSSGTHALHARGGAGNNTNNNNTISGVDENGIVVCVMKNVITINDMGVDDDADSRTKGSVHGEWSANEMA
ncbi:hypothetical protein DFH09DRAFT_1093843 [Mycena vulgaris]|nr:hypothetical protein DFH09DRAFT_1093843 [Mycena vulgaris]